VTLDACAVPVGFGRAFHRWDAIKYLIAEANYGGRITDDWDRRLCNVYVSQFFCEEILTVRDPIRAAVEGLRVPA
jgi:hypothetical protein